MYNVRSANGMELEIGGVQWLGDGAKTREADRSAIEDFDGCSTYSPLVIGGLLFMVYSTGSRVNRGMEYEQGEEPREMTV